MGVFEIAVLGFKYRIKSDLDKKDFLYLTSYVEEKLDEIKRCTNIVDTIDVIVLAMLNIARDYIQEKREKERVEREVKERIEKIIDFIDLTLERFSPAVSVIDR